MLCYGIHMYTNIYRGVQYRASAMLYSPATGATDALRGRGDVVP